MGSVDGACCTPDGKAAGRPGAAVRPAKAHRRATTPQSMSGSVAAELARAGRDEFERQAAEARRWAALDVAIDAASAVARSQEEFDTLVHHVEALLLEGE